MVRDLDVESDVPFTQHLSYLCSSTLTSLQRDTCRYSQFRHPKVDLVIDYTTSVPPISLFDCASLGTWHQEQNLKESPGRLGYWAQVHSLNSSQTSVSLTVLGSAGIAELAIFHPVDTIAKRKFSLITDFETC